MSEQVLVSKDKIIAVADAIRTKLGTTDTMTLDQMPTKVESIPSGGSSELAKKLIEGTVTELTADDLKDVTKLKPYLSVSISGGYMPTGTIASIELSDTVATLENYCLAYCPLTTVTLPSTVTGVSAGAFYGCSQLATVVIDAPLTTIESSVFGGCTALNSITLPSTLTSIGEDAFSECTSLTSISLPSSVTTLDEGAFKEAGIKSFTFTSNITNVGDEVFSECDALESVDYGTTLTSIPVEMFYRCTALKSFTIPSQVTSIGYEAFSGSGLESITIPATVTSMGTSIFSSCTSLANVKFEGSPSSIPSGMFQSCPLNVLDLINATSVPTLDEYYSLSAHGNPFEIKVNLGLVDAFKNAENWRSYSEYIKGYGTATLRWINGDGSVIAQADYTGADALAQAIEDGKSIYTPTKEGYSFDEWVQGETVVTGPGTARIDMTGKFYKSPPYTVTWLNIDGSVFDTTTVDERGATPSHSLPSGAYIWSPTPSAIEDDATYQAKVAFIEPTITLTQDVQQTVTTSAEHPEVVEGYCAVCLFVPQGSSGVYTLRSYCLDGTDTYARLYKADGTFLVDDDEGAGTGGDFALCWDLQQGEAYIYAVSIFGGVSASDTIPVKVYEGEP